MSVTAAHPNKPRTVLCRLRHLMRWTGWTEYEINLLVKEGALRVLDHPGRATNHANRRRLFYVQSAQQILDNDGKPRINTDGHG